MLHFVINNLCSINLGRHAELFLSLCPAVDLLESSVLNWCRFAKEVGNKTQRTGKTALQESAHLPTLEFILQSPRGRGLVAAYNPNSAEEEAERSLGPLATQFHLLEEFQATGKPCLPTASLLRKVANA